MKFDVNDKYRPAFVFPKTNKTAKATAQYITLKGDLSDKKNPIEVRIDGRKLEASQKPDGYIKALKTFNEEEEEDFI